jgi:hypothetical protein
VGRPSPILTQVLDGRSPRQFRFHHRDRNPRQRRSHSGGGREITEALMQDAAGEPFAELMQALVLGSAGSAD